MVKSFQKIIKKHYECLARLAASDGSGESERFWRDEANSVADVVVTGAYFLLLKDTFQLTRINHYQCVINFKIASALNAFVSTCIC
jgi:hypothetical protein